MADLWTSALRAALLTERPRFKRVARFNSPGTRWDERVIDWGEVTMSVYNRHPTDAGRWVIPTVELVVDNADGFFDSFPNEGRTTWELVEIEIYGLNGVDTETKVFAIAGWIRSVKTLPSGLHRLVIEDRSIELSERYWRRSHRTYGTGYATGMKPGP